LPHIRSNMRKNPGYSFGPLGLFAIGSSQRSYY
jgi:hypothetical protein